MAKSHALTGKRKRFADEYLVDLNATAAYKRAGYKAKNGHVADSAASRLLGKVDVAAYVAERQQALAEKAGVTAQWVREELKANHERFRDGLVPGHAAASTKALELLGKDHGMFVDRHEHRLTISFAELVEQSLDGEE